MVGDYNLVFILKYARDDLSLSLSLSNSLQYYFSFLFYICSSLILATLFTPFLGNLAKRDE